MSQASVLIVDDEALNVEILSEHLEDDGYEVLQALDGLEACRILEQEGERLNLVLLDRTMPSMDGLEVLRKMKCSPGLQDIPVIMQTQPEDEKVHEVLEAGAFSFLTKPYENEVLLAIVRTAVEEYDRYKSLKAELNQNIQSVKLLKEGRFVFRTMNEARTLATFIAQAYPNPDKAVFGISELMINAVEHGNLGITYDEKSELMKSNLWEEEIAQRLEDARYSHRLVEVNFRHDGHQVLLTIEDEGEGFDWRLYETLSSERASHVHGRGIAMARVMSFSDVTYVGKGNRVVCTLDILQE